MHLQKKFTPLCGGCSSLWPLLSICQVKLLRVVSSGHRNFDPLIDTIDKWHNHWVVAQLTMWWNYFWSSIPHFYLHTSYLTYLLGKVKAMPFWYHLTLPWFISFCKSISNEEISGESISLWKNKNSPLNFFFTPLWHRIRRSGVPLANNALKIDKLQKRFQRLEQLLTFAVYV